MDKEIDRIEKHACEKIKFYRRINNLSQADMAEKLWMSQRAYHRLENGETSLTLHRIHQLSKIFKISIPQLIGLDFKMEDKDVLREVRELNEQYLTNERKIIEILNELKSRIS